MDELSGAELADRSGVAAEQLRRLVELGIITPTPQGRFRPSDIQRIRVVDTLADAGFAPEQLSELIATGAYNLDCPRVRLCTCKGLRLEIPPDRNRQASRRTGPTARRRSDSLPPRPTRDFSAVR
jgi:DNA-binding transcriptional MerR regulator